MQNTFVALVASVSLAAYPLFLCADEPLKIPLPTVGMYTVYPKDHILPYTTAGSLDDSKLFRGESNFEGFAILPPGKVLAINADQSEYDLANIKSFAGIPSDRLLRLSLCFQSFPASNYKELSRFPICVTSIYFAPNPNPI